MLMKCTNLADRYFHRFRSWRSFLSQTKSTQFGLCFAFCWHSPCAWIRAASPRQSRAPSAKVQHNLLLAAIVDVRKYLLLLWFVLAKCKSTRTIGRHCCVYFMPDEPTAFALREILSFDALRLRSFVQRLQKLSLNQITEHTNLGNGWAGQI